MKLSIVINSTKDYASITLPPLFESLKLAPHMSEDAVDIVVIINGFDHFKIYPPIKNYRFIETDNNSFNYSGLITVLENPEILATDHFLFMDDTSKVGPQFFQCLANIPDISANQTISAQFPSAYVGIYSKTALQNHSAHLLQFKNKDYSEKALQVLKHKTVLYEDSLFRENAANHLFLPRKSEPQWGKDYDVYNTGVKRMPEYYPDLDLTRFKGTWSRHDNLDYTVLP